ncbi:DUF484 family protein [Endothiovibrio diazotrophicus]
MSEQGRPRGDGEDPQERSVADYLHTNPHFFERHLDLLEELRVPHPAGGAVSLIERQVQRLQHENHKIKGKLLQMVENARENERINDRMHGLALALMEADGLDEVAITIDDVFRNDFNADAVALRLLEREGIPAGTNTPRVPVGDPAFAPLYRFVERRKPDCERLNEVERRHLFGEQAGRIASTVVIPLHGSADYGLLVVGSEDADRFHPGQGTLYLERMGELISRALRRHIG